MHVKDMRAFHRIDEIKTLVDSCTFFYAEMDLAEAQGSNHADQMQLESTDLIQLYGKKNFDRIRKSILKSFHIDLLQFIKLKPLFIVNLLSEQVLNEEYSIPLDHYLWKYALSKGKIMGGIESYADQLRIMEKLDLKVSLKALKDVSRNTSKFRKSIRRLMDYYVKEDIQLLYSQSKRSIGKLRGILLKDRNYYMASRILDFMDQGPSFITLGAAHMAGKYGVLNLLKQGGIKFKALK